MNLILLGYRGSGKTSIGRKLASQMWKTFADVDAEVCKRFDGRTVAEIWQQQGEPAFRAAEVAVTKDLIARPDHVIALGGGTLMQPEARAAVEAADAKRLYLHCQPAVLAERIAADAASAATRPDLTGLGGGVEEVEAVLREREPVYRAVADEVFDVSHTNLDEAVRHIIQRHL